MIDKTAILFEAHEEYPEDAPYAIEMAIDETVAAVVRSLHIKATEYETTNRNAVAAAALRAFARDLEKA